LRKKVEKVRRFDRKSEIKRCLEGFYYRWSPSGRDFASKE